MVLGDFRIKTNPFFHRTYFSSRHPVTPEVCELFALNGPTGTLGEQDADVISGIVSEKGVQVLDTTIVGYDSQCTIMTESSNECADSCKASENCDAWLVIFRNYRC